LYDVWTYVILSNEMGRLAFILAFGARGCRFESGSPALIPVREIAQLVERVKMDVVFCLSHGLIVLGRLVSVIHCEWRGRVFEPRQRGNFL
jgi:hypothetical protein